MKNFETERITLRDEVETREALRIKKEQTKKIIAIPLVPLACVIIFLSLLLTNINNSNLVNVFSTLLSVSGLATIVCLIVYNSLMAPYCKLVKIASRNDQIRHDEKIRFKERKRLEESYNEELTRQNINKTIKLEEEKD